MTSENVQSTFQYVIENRLTNFIKIYFNFAYYLAISPFRFGYDSSSQTIVMKKSRLQNVRNVELYTCIL